MSYNKLVRDNIPDIIRNNGEEPIIRVLSDEEYKKELEIKLLEECNEVLNSKGRNRIEELADVLEVLIAIGKLEGVTFEKIQEMCSQKRNKRGAFDKKIYLQEVK